MVTRKEWNRTTKGYLSNIYSGMRSRVRNPKSDKHYLYKGLKLLTREEFCRWANNCPSFSRLHREWTESGFERRLSPSVDRIDSTRGYVLGNIQWITQSENSSLGALSDKRDYRGPKNQPEIRRKQFMRSIERIILVVLMMGAMSVAGWALAHKEKPIQLNIDKSLCEMGV